MENFKIILNKIKQITNARTDADIARALSITPQALFSFKKQKKFPYELLIKYCFNNKISIDWLLSSEIKSEKLKHVEIFDADNDDHMLYEILQWLKDNPHDKEMFLKLINCKKGIIEVLESFKNTGNIS